MSNTKLTNAQLAQMVETQKDTLSLIQRRISKLSDQLALMAEDTERFKVAVSRDMDHLSKRIN